MNLRDSLLRTGQAVALLCFGVGVGLAISPASASPDHAAALHTLERRLAALEAVIVVGTDSVKVGHRSAYLQVQRGAVELTGKTVQVVGSDQAVMRSGTQARIDMTKAGDVTVSGRRIEIKGSQDVQVKGRKIANN